MTDLVALLEYIDLYIGWSIHLAMLPCNIFVTIYMSSASKSCARAYARVCLRFIFYYYFFNLCC